MKFEKVERRRDNQQWMLDYLVMATGKTMLFDHKERWYPDDVRSYRMMPKHMARQARHKEEIARAADAAEHYRTASQLYFSAILDYHQAQHAIFQDDNPQKLRYYQALASCYDRSIDLADYPVEKVDIPWEGQVISCLFHLLPDRRKAPTVLFIPGMDMIKELYPRVVENVFLGRGLHCLSMDGPGQGVSNIRKLRVTDDNYEKAARAVISYLATRPEVDATKIGVCGVSMGSHWGVRTAALDPRVAAVATASSCYGSKLPIFEMASPRFKQVFMYMSGIHDEARFDEMAGRMTCLGYGGKIQCPSLMVVGEYDQLCFLDDSLALHDELAGPAELWLLEDEPHNIYALEGLGGVDAMPFMADWLKDALNGKITGKRIVWVAKDHGKGPYSEASPTLTEEQLYF